MRMCLIFVSVPFSVLQRIFPCVYPAIWFDSLSKQNVSHHQNHVKVNYMYNNRYIKSDRTTDRQTDKHTWLFVRFGFWLVDFFGILNPFQSTGTSLIMSTTSLICKIQSAITYLVYIIFFLAFREFLPNNGNVSYLMKYERPKICAIKRHNRSRKAKKQCLAC